MARHGFIHDKLGIKLLVLYILARVAAPIDYATLTDQTMCDEGVDYFQFSETVAELLESGHIALDDDKYSITEKGRRNGEACETALSHAIRLRCERNLTQLNAALRRSAQVRAEILPRDDGALTLRLSLDDEGGSLLTLELMAPSEQQAQDLAARFLASPDAVYNGILSVLLQDGQEPTQPT